MLHLLEVEFGCPCFFPQHFPRRLIAKNAGRLGNEMFVYASLISIGAMNNMTPVYYTSNRDLWDTFRHLTVLKDLCQYKSETDEIKIQETSNIFYDVRMERLHQLPTDHVFIAEYFQSWKYLKNSEAVVRREFTFADSHQNAADKFIRESHSSSVWLVFRLFVVQHCSRSTSE